MIFQSLKTLVIGRILRNDIFLVRRLRPRIVVSAVVIIFGSHRGAFVSDLCHLFPAVVNYHPGTPADYPVTPPWAVSLNFTKNEIFWLSVMSELAKRDLCQTVFLFH